MYKIAYQLYFGQALATSLTPRKARCCKMSSVVHGIHHMHSKVKPNADPGGQGPIPWPPGWQVIPEPAGLPCHPPPLKPEHKCNVFQEALWPCHFQKMILLLDFNEKTFTKHVTLLPLLWTFIGYLRTSRKINYLKKVFVVNSALVKNKMHMVIMWKDLNVTNLA